MTANSFGGVWTKEKLAVLGEYLQFFTRALKRQGFDLVYIDAFAGTGRCKITTDGGGQEVIDGSAKIALDCDPGFHRLKFIESRREFATELPAADR